MPLASAVRWIPLLVLGAVLGAGPASAAVSAPVVAAAKREATVVWYTSLDAPTLAVVTARFKQRYPEIAVETLRISTAEIPARVLTEQRAGHYAADLIQADETQLYQLIAAGALDVYRPDEAPAFIKGSLEPRGYWTTLYFVTAVIAWNPQKLKEHGLRPPATMADLAAPQWKGRIGLNAQAFNWYNTLNHLTPSAADLLRRIALNEPLLTTTHTGTVTQLEAGEFDATPTAYGYLAERDKDAGRAIDYVNLRPQVALPDSLSLAKNAPHPNAARLLYEWLLSREGQETIVAASARTSPRTDVAGDRRVFDPKLPYIVVRGAEPDRFNVLIKEMRTLLGVQGM